MTETRSPTLSGIITDAVVFWERGRVIYNVILLAVTLIALGPFWGECGAFSWVSLVLLAVIANVLYTSGYVPDLLAQHTPWRSAWRHLRWGLWLFGTGLSAYLALQFALSIAIVHW